MIDLMAGASKMSTRIERRLEAKKVKKKLKNPIVRRIVKAELASDHGLEIYRLDDDGTGRPMFFNISEMRSWAEGNLEIFQMPVDFQRAERLVESGAVDPDHIRNHTIQHEPQPMLVCRNCSPSGDQIVDGAHRFVAMCMGAAMVHESSGIPISQFSLPGYVLTPDQWRRFVIPPSIAKKFKFGD